MKLLTKIPGVLYLVCFCFAAPAVHAETIASQDFGATNFPTNLNLDTQDNTVVTHTGSGASGTDLGFFANGITSTTEGGTFEVAGGEVTFIHFSSTSDVSTLPSTDSLSGASTVTFEQGTDHTAFVYTEVVDLSGHVSKSVSIDVGDVVGASNTGDDDILVRLWVNGDTEVVLVDTRGNANGDLVFGTLTHNFADSDTSAQLLVDLFSDDAGDGYRIDNILFEGVSAAQTIASQDFGLTNFPEPNDANQFNGINLSHTSTGTTDLGFAHSGITSTTSGGTAGVVGEAFQITHYSSTGDSNQKSQVDFGNVRTGFVLFESVDLTAFNSALFSMDLFDAVGSSNDGDEAVVVRLLLNGQPYDGTSGVVLFDNRASSGSITPQNLTYDFADTDTSVQLVVDVFADDATDGYSIDNILFEGILAVETIASQDFGLTNFPEPNDANQFNGINLSHTSTGTTDLGFAHSGITSTTSGGTAGVVGEAFQITHYSSTGDSNQKSQVDFGNVRTGFVLFESVDLTAFNSALFSMDLFDAVGSSNDGDEAVVVRLLLNGQPYDGTSGVVLFDNRASSGSITPQNLTYDFADTDTSVQLVVDVFADDATDGYSIDNILFEGVASGGPAPISLALIDKGATWTYLDDGSDQGTAWKEPAFDDSSWASGPGPLGGGDSHIATTVDIGPSGARHITTYFRHEFSVADASKILSLTLGILRDDGVVVYLNGAEVTRQNMPVGAIDYLTETLSIISGSAETTYFPATADPALLVNGTNVIAVEVHQRDAFSSDLGFDLELVGSVLPGDPPTVVLTAPAEGATFDAPAAISLAADASDSDGTVALVEFFEGENKVGEDASSPFTFDWTGVPTGNYTLTAVATDDVGVQTTSAAVNVTVTNTDNIAPAVAITSPTDGQTVIGEPVVITATATDGDGSVAKVEFFEGANKLGEDTTAPFSYDWTGPADGNYTLTAVATDNDGATTTSAAVNITVADPIIQPLLSRGGTWKYLDDGSDQGTAWKEPAFDDSSWASGAGPLGGGDAHIVTNVDLGPSGARHITTYFRQEFTVVDPSDIVALNLGILRDDGVVVYLNGTEVTRQNMPSGAIDYLTETPAIVSGSDETVYFPATADPALLVSGTNVIAVEVHQRDGNSSDLGFDLEMSVSILPSNPPTINLVSPADGATGIGLGGTVTLEATVSDPEDEPLTVTFYGREASPTPGEDFTLVAIPDTQNYTDVNQPGNLPNFINQTNWIVSAKDSLNIAFVSHLGDVAQNYNQQEQEYINANQAMVIIEDPVTTMLADGIPWGVTPGNHDIGSGQNTSLFNQYFGVSRFSGRGYYQGYYGSNNDNNYQYFSASGLDFIVVNIKYDAGTVEPAILDWADALLKAHPNRRAIVTSHNFLQESGDWQNADWHGHGQIVYESLKDNPNLFMMLCGHRQEEGMRTETFEGNTVYILLSDYQGRSGGGGSWLRYYVFSPANGTITAKTYQTTTGQFETDVDSEFTLSYDMGQSVAPWSEIGTLNLAGGVNDATVDWIGVAGGTEYEWYAAVTDGIAPVASGVRSFTTASNSPPTVTLDAPLNSATIALPATVDFAATASDPDGTIARVEFYNGETLVGEDESAPYTLSWSAASGSYTLTARAIDNQGASTDTSPVNVTVTNPNNVPPSVALTAPVDESSFPAGTSNLTATASDSDGFITVVEFFEGNNKLGEDTEEPFEFAWVADTAGSFSLTAVATDNDGGMTTSSAADVTILPVTTATFRQGLSGYNGAVDTQIAEASPNSAFGTATELSADTSDGGGQNHLLLRFDDVIGGGALQVPAGSTVASATLTLEITSEGSGFNVHPMLVSWDDSVTWNNAFGGNGIQADDAEASSTVTDSTSGVATGQLQVDLTALVQAWADGETNYGFALLPLGSDGVDFYTSDYVFNEALRPTLTVEFVRPVTVSIVAADATAGENNGDATFSFTVSRTGDTAVPLSVALSSSGSATAGSDYAGFSGGLTIPANQSSEDLTLTVLGDNLAEGQETVIIGVVDTADYDLGANASASATIADAASQDYFFNNIADPDKRGAGDDADGDDVPNLVEFFFGFDLNDVGSIPAIDPTFFDGEDFTFGFQRNQNATGVTGTFEWSTDLVGWQASGASNGEITVTITESVIQDNGDGTEMVQGNGAIEGPVVPSEIFVRVRLAE